MKKENLQLTPEKYNGSEDYHKLLYCQPLYRIIWKKKVASDYYWTLIKSQTKLDISYYAETCENVIFVDQNGNLSADKLYHSTQRFSFFFYN